MIRDSRGKPTYFSQALAHHPVFRFLVVMLALVQIIAPLWHVCERGGRCNECPRTDSALNCHVEATDQLVSLQLATPQPISSQSVAPQSARPPCSRCKPVKLKAEKAAPEKAVAQQDSRPDRFKGTCLARELMSMGRVTVAPLSLDFQVTRVRMPRLCKIARRRFCPFKLPLSRGPPAPFAA